jgi:hypothetical protein
MWLRPRGYQAAQKRLVRSTIAMKRAMADKYGQRTDDRDGYEKEVRQ